MVRKRKNLTRAQMLRDDKAFGGWYRLTCIAKNGKKVVQRRPTKANIDILAGVYRKKGCKNVRIIKLKRKK